MRRIDRAWGINLERPKDTQFESKEEIVKECCPNGNTLKVDEQTISSCAGGNGNCGRECYECWNEEISTPIEETIHNKDKIIETEDDSELTFDNLGYWTKNSDKDVYITSEDEEALINDIKDNESIVNLSTYLTLDEIPSITDYLQKLYKYGNKLKNKVEYVDFQTAFNHLKNGRQIRCEDYIYKVEDDRLMYSCKSWDYEDFRPSDGFDFKEINSNEWVLL